MNDGWIPLINALYHTILFFFVHFYARSRLAWIFSAYAFSVIVWNFGSYQLFVVREEAALFWGRFLHVGIILLCPSMVHLAVGVLRMEREYKRLLAALYSLAILFGILHFKGLFVTEITDMGYAYYSRGGFFFSTFSILLYSAALYAMWLTQKQSSEPYRFGLSRLIYYSFALLILGGVNDMLPIFGITYYPFTTVQVYPWGSLLPLLYGTLNAIAVLKLVALDIPSFGRSLALFSARALGVVCVFAVPIAWLADAPLYPDFNRPIFPLAVLVSIFFGLGIVMPPYLRERRRGSARNELQPVENFGGIVKELEAQLEALNVYHYAWLAELPEGNVRVLSGNLELDPEILRRGVPTLPKTRNLMKPKPTGDPPKLFYPLIRHERRVGFLAMLAIDRPRQNLSLLRYILETLSRIDSPSLRKDLSASREQATLGLMPPGVAHDLQNLLMPVRTYFELSARGSVQAQRVSDSARQNLDHLEGLLKSSQAFQNKSALSRSSLNVRALLEKCMQLQNLRLTRKKIGYLLEADKSTIQANEALMLRALVNLVTNATDAAPENSSLVISSHRENDHVFLSIWDRGPLIPADVLDKLSQQQQFSTKGADRGWGLPICQRIVEMHDGTLRFNIQSNQWPCYKAVQIQLASE